ncbi:MAG: terminase small subunit [Pelagibacterales bacterium]|nr:terminase small subunit [Pelagibacterales bacterium]
MTKLVDKQLTQMQKIFANLYVENFYGKTSLNNTEIAIKAGYAPESSYQRAYELLNPKISPHVVKFIGELKEDFRIRNSITPDKHMARLEHLGRRAENKDMLGVAMRAEELRGKVAGYYVDRQIIKRDNIDDLSEEQLEDKMKQITEDYSLLLDDKSKKNGDRKNGK